ncbi:MAG: phosphate acyltransferase PlsX [Bacteroidetes bacterium]|nr:phosphate acyltransferase PlsX [Bacteroidota bacterium]MCW5896623.1 phosphate acyltransferase PlsX [Bacteroidota bacterium]
MRIAVDAMGGDYAPQNVVAGALDALDSTGGRFSLLLVGQEERIQQELQKHPVAQALKDSYTITDAREIIEFNDGATAALKTKKDSSLAVAIALHRDGNADAVVSAGHTGAMLSASTLLLGRIGGIGRPTIGALIPTSAHIPSLLVDAGTNVDCKPRHLFEFAVMGSTYIEAMLGKKNPSVGLLSIGEEDNKGNEVTLEAFALLKNSKLNFFGNVEGRDILKGKVDVVVCDGFIGNILLKFGESVPAFFKAKFMNFADRSIINKLVALVARSGMRSVMKELDYQEHGGVPLLGVNGVSIIGHGGSTPKAIKNMIFRAEEMVQRKVNARIQEAMKQYA